MQDIQDMQKNNTFSFNRSDFPKDFIFGTATSSYQIEGSSLGDCGRSHWDDFAETPGNTYNQETAALACQHYNHWQQDLDLLRLGGFDAYRFSVSWARIFPNNMKQPNPKALDFYDKLVDGMLERGIQPFCCLHHWDLPSYLADKGGWRNRDTAICFAEFSSFVYRRLGDRLAGTNTVNEPWCIAWLSHFLGLHAPGLRDIRAASRAMHYVLLAHGLAMQALRAESGKNLGIILNFEKIEPIDQKPENIEAAALVEGIYNRWFLQAIFKKSYPSNVLEQLSRHMPENYELDFPIIAQKLDWLGINYYTRARIASGHAQNKLIVKQEKGDLPQTSMGWEIYPQGIHYIIRWIHQNYTKNLPLYVSENGMAWHDAVESDAVHDHRRVRYFNDHIHEVKKLVSDGIPLKGYFCWSLLDNYEWTFGYKERFGLVHVNFESQKRTPKDSFLAFKKSLST